VAKGRFRGPSLATKLMLLGAALLSLPYFSLRQLLAMEQFLIQGQAQAQLLTAEGISTLLNGRDDLFNDLPLSAEGYASLYAHPLPSAIRLDGRDGDWDVLAERRLVFGADPDSGERPDGSFDLILGERADQLYAVLRILDRDRIWRDPDALRLDNADHVRLTFQDASGARGRIQLTFSGPGVLTAYAMDEAWRFASNGQPDNRIQGFVSPTNTGEGYVVEFRLPLAMLNARESFGISVVDVDDPVSRSQRAMVQTLPTAGPEAFNLIVLRSPEVLNIVEGLGYAGARILVIDGERRVRAETGAYQREGPRAPPLSAPALGPLEFFRPLVRGLLAIARLGQEDGAAPMTSDAVIDTALAGGPLAVRRRLSDKQEIIMAAVPIRGREQALGAVVVEQDTDEILALQRDALDRIIGFAVLTIALVFLALLTFSLRLAWRIRGLGAEASRAIDQQGRLRTFQLRREARAGDELGELSRNVSQMLARLHQHNQFLENMPRTLRHEINNPLNTLSTSLQNLEDTQPELSDSKYLDAARRGVQRIGAIVQNLADAANLEESLKAEDLETLDLEALVESYVRNSAALQAPRQLTFQGPGTGVKIEAADYRIEQLLDKIIDNALDFALPETAIAVALRRERSDAVLTIRNQGPLLSEDTLASMFDSMVTRRDGTNDTKLHFGLGLYVVRVIAAHHGGGALARNLPDGSGVEIEVRLPLAQRLRGNAR
jgi:two-component system, OmpR family, sensor histidine kinase ChvG